MINRLTNFLTTQQTLIGLSLVRIIFGIAMLYELAMNIPTRFLLWGPNGIVSYEAYQKIQESNNIYTLFDLGSELWVVNAIVFGGIVVSILYIIGFQTRIMGVLMAILMFSIYTRDYMITHGGDNILRLLFVYLMFANVGAYFSVDAWWRKRRKRKWFAKLRDNQGIRDFVAIIHNFAWIACVVQLFFMYFASGSYKIMGELWQNGTALYYASRVQEFYTPGLNDLLWKYEPILILATYATTIFQVAFPFLMLNRYTKYFAVFSACLLHIGIAVSMGLVDFSWVMIGCECMLLFDKDYRILASWWKRIFSKKQTKSESPPSQPAVST
ncbi:HTTM domain-containing protein [Shimazuella kribbensis]|uniref:HTTM domain-containing protein n=1 Tax=Shimazuella kribbensis TaxID=139808 RepID=UPI00040141C8|nr:HTTM domain-containing protein [Shimazuella kribbensis]